LQPHIGRPLPIDTPLTPYETRVLGCLVEKEATTPEQYPLSLAALTQACNQKTNRDPVLDLDPSTVQEALDSLAKKHLASEKSGFGSRVPKYQHRINSEFGRLRLSRQELGLLCVLFLRGPQTAGELRTRTARLCSFADVQEAEAVLEGLMTREDGPFVARLAREPGRREPRYAHLFGGPVEEASAEPAAAEPPPQETSRLERLEATVLEMRAQLDRLEEQVRALRGGGQDQGD
jgi:uncharacterized protein YceH (UPF0502 family)